MNRDIEAAERRCLALAPPRALGKRAAVSYLARKGALWKLDTPVSVLRPSGKLKQNLTVPRFLLWNRGVPHHREL